MTQPWDVERYIRDYEAAIGEFRVSRQPFADGDVERFWAGMRRYYAEIEPDDTSPEVPVTDLPDDVPNGDIGATEPEEPQ